jgi:hypothetical protein
MSDDIERFLLARITEDEAKIQHMTREAERVATAPIFRGHPVDWLAGVDIFVSPTRWQAECEAKRQVVVAAAESMCSMVCQDSCGWDTLRSLASVYADHPDYRQEWRA